jgi:outer membrane protein assembly factor BamB
MAASRLRTVLRWVALSGIATIAIGLVLYQFFGLRYRPDGSGRPGLGFITPHDAQAEAVERHRREQRLAAEAAAPASSSASEPASGNGTAAVANIPTPDTEATDATAPADDTGGAAASSYWTDFRGPNRDGRYLQQPLLRAWPAEGLRPMWKQPIGGGYASFVAAEGRAFTIEQRGRNEVVAAYDIDTGRELWTHGWPALFEETMGGDGPRATPTWSSGVLYALGALGELRALDARTGRQLWRVNILDDNRARNLDWGMAASPLVVGDTVIVLPGGQDGRSIVAYHRRTGARVWSSEDDQQAYAAPMLARLGGRDQLLVFTANQLMGLTPDRGLRLWSHPWPNATGINVAQPLVVGESRVFVSSGYDVGAAVLELVPRATGSDGYDVREVWRNNRMKNKFTSSVLHDGFIYGLDEAILACVDASTGQLKWKGGRYGYGQLVLAGDRIIVQTEEGDLVLVAASPERHQELGRFAAISGRSWNHPALDRGRLLVRNLREMAAFDLRIR